MGLYKTSARWRSHRPEIRERILQNQGLLTRSEPAGITAKGERYLEDQRDGDDEPTPREEMGCDGW